MRHNYKSGAVPNPPSVANAGSLGFPTEADPASVPGAWLFYVIAESIVRVQNEAGLVATDDPDQLKDAIQSIVNTAINNLVIPDGVDLATRNEHLQANPPANKAAVPAYVKAMIDVLIDNAPANLNTLGEIATFIQSLVRVAGDTMTGTLLLPTLAASANGKQATPADWVLARISEGAMGTLLYSSAVGAAITQVADTTVALTDSLSNYDGIRLTGYRMINEDNREVRQSMIIPVSVLPSTAGTPYFRPGLDGAGSASVSIRNVYGSGRNLSVHGATLGWARLLSVIGIRYARP